ncbi:MAG: radical SAM protein [Thermodesulfobacteriota bacterium]
MEGPCLDVQDWTPFGRALAAKAMQADVPLSGTLELTAACNLSCVHCYLGPHQSTGASGRKELTAGEICGILDQIASEGCLWLLLTGGEPFVRPDALDIYEHAKRRGFLITVFTNGTTLTPSIADHMTDLPPFSIEITLYGRTRATYEGITRAPGSYDRCMRGIHLLLERNLPLKLKSMIMTSNLHEIEQMKSFARELGVEFRYDTEINAGLDGNSVPVSLRVSPEAAVELDRTDAKRLQGWRDLHRRSKTLQPRHDYVYRCGAALSNFHVDSFGRLSACVLSRDPSYDVRKGGFREAWHTLATTVRNMPATRQTPCRRCEITWLCGVCPGKSQLEAGHPEAELEYFCRVAHLRSDLLELSPERSGASK